MPYACWDDCRSIDSIGSDIIDIHPQSSSVLQLCVHSVAKKLLQSKQVQVHRHCCTHHTISDCLRAVHVEVKLSFQEVI